MEKATNAEQQARAQLEKIHCLVENLQKAREADWSGINEAKEEIHKYSLNVQVRSEWHAPGDNQKIDNAQYTILLCTGGPAVRIKGTLDDYSEPATAQLEYQDWGTPWTRLTGLTSEDIEALLVYAGCFYFAALND